MDFKELKELVKQGEGKQLEFKLKSNHPDRIVREIVAFANTKGGQLLIGVDDDRSIKGLKYADEDEYILVRAIEKHCSPLPDYDIERIHIGDEREVLVFVVPPSTQRPHYLLTEPPPDKKNGIATSKPKSASLTQTEMVRKAYVRVGDKAIQASWEVREILRRQDQNRNVRFNFGDKEKTLMQYLDQNPSVTVNDFAALAAIPRKIASKTLVILVLANVLKIQPDDVADRFSIN